MSQLNRISSCSAITFWNNFLSSFSSPVPFSFNPSLFNFYIRYFHWKPYYFLLFYKNKAAGLLPLVNTGNSWVSLPHFSYGGFACTENFNFKLDEDIIQKLIFLVQKERHNQGFFQYDLKTISSYQTSHKRIFIRTIHKYPTQNNYIKVSSIIFLPKTKEELFTKLNTNLRRKINKANHSEFNIQIGGKELLESFHSIYSKKMHELGSPAYGKHFFKTILETYCYGDAKIFLVRKQKKAVGAAFLLSYNGFYESAWFATNKIEYKNYISDFLHWQMLKYAIEKRAYVYSFGRSTSQGSVHIYKSHWPVENIPIYQYNNNQKNVIIRNKRWISSVWRKVPYFIAKPTGALLVKHIY